MKTPRPAKCELCAVNLTSKVEHVDRVMGRKGTRRMLTLVAPPRVELTISAGKGFVRVFLCPAHYSPSHVMVMMDKLLDGARLPLLKEVKP